MTYNLVMPQLGLTMEEGSVVSWRKQPGDWVEKGEVLFIVETDKAEMEVESTDSGYLSSTQVELRKKVRVGTVIAILADAPGELACQEGAALAEAVTAAPVQERSAAESKSTAQGVTDWRTEGAAASLPESVPGREFAASPRARRLAEELGIDLSAVRPGRGRRIVEEDVRRFQANREETPARAPAAEAPPTPSRAASPYKHPRD
jgi:pyruvate dehydrogenase E2 component (dihydrolipoamide acetyltransferase)